MISEDQLKAIMPYCKNPGGFLPELNKAMVEGEINTPLRQAAFLAQLAHESGELRYWEELASGAAYEGRKDLGNTQPGDGIRYKGRGPIQLTGRNNYRLAGQALGVDLENDPKRAAQLDVGFRVASWFWKSKGLNQLADAVKYDEITKRINGGTRGLEHRLRYYETAKRALGVIG